MIQPDYIVHELVARTGDELHLVIQQQKALVVSLDYIQ